LRSFKKRVVRHDYLPTSPSPMFDRQGGKWSIALTSRQRVCGRICSMVAKFLSLHPLSSNW
jgi:hypothetical protein